MKLFYSSSPSSMAGLWPGAIALLLCATFSWVLASQPDLTVPVFKACVLLPFLVLGLAITLTMRLRAAGVQPSQIAEATLSGALLMAVSLCICMGVQPQPATVEMVFFSSLVSVFAGVAVLDLRRSVKRLSFTRY